AVALGAFDRLLERLLARFYGPEHRRERVLLEDPEGDEEREERVDHQVRPDVRQRERRVLLGAGRSSVFLRERDASVGDGQEPDMKKIANAHEFIPSATRELFSKKRAGRPGTANPELPV